MSAQIYLILTLLLLALCPSLRSQGYTITNLVGTNGPSNSQVNVIYLDSDSMLWLGTGNTVERFDGNAYLCYTFKEQPLLKGENIISSLVQTAPYAYWAGNKKGVWRLNHDTRLLERAFAEEVNFPVNKLDRDDRGNLYIGTANGLYIYDGGEGLQHILFDKSVGNENNHLLDIHVRSEKEVWWLLSDGLVFCNPSAGITTKYPYSTEKSSVSKFTCLLRVDDQLYIGTEKQGVVVFDLKKHRYFSLCHDWASAVSCLTYDPDGVLGVGTTNDGIFLISLKDRQVIYSGHYNEKGNEGLVSNCISSMLIYDKDVWVGTKFYVGWNHLDYHNPLFGIYGRGDFTSRDIPIRSFLRTGEYVFLGTREGFYVIDEHTGTRRHYAMGKPGADNLRSNLIFSFYRYNNQYLIGTYRSGIYLFDPHTGSLSLHPLFHPLDNSDIFMFLTDEHNDLWIASLNGLYHYRAATQELKGYAPSNSSIPGDIVYCILIDSRKRFWVATNKGVALFDRKTEKFITPVLPDSLNSDKDIVEFVYEDRSGHLFLGTLGGDLFVTDKDLKSCTRLFSKTELVVENIMQDNDGRFWIGTDKGVLRMEENFKGIVCYSGTDEIPVLMANPGTALMKDDAGKIWMAGVKGLVCINPAVGYYPSAIRITDVIVDGKSKFGIETADRSVIRVSDGERNVTFCFSLKDCNSILPHTLEYKLEGYEQNWQTIRGKGEISYFNLPPGNYTFKIRRLLNDASMAQMGVSIPSKVEAWQWTLGIFLLLTVAYAVARRIRRQKKELVSVGELPSPVPSPDVDVAEAVLNKAGNEPKNDLRLSEEELQEMIRTVKRYMETKKPYLDVDFKQADMAQATGYSIYMLSRMFNLYMNTGYYEYVNNYRVEEFKSLVKQGEHKKYTLGTLAGKCGFKAQASFFRAFRKQTGMTPNEYIRQRDVESETTIINL